MTFRTQFSISFDVNNTRRLAMHLAMIGATVKSWPLMATEIEAVLLIDKSVYESFGEDKYTTDFLQLRNILHTLPGQVSIISETFH